MNYMGLEMPNDFGQSYIPINNMLVTLSPKRNQKNYNKLFTETDPSPSKIMGKYQDFESSVGREVQFKNQAETKFEFDTAEDVQDFDDQTLISKSVKESHFTGNQNFIPSKCHNIEIDSSFCSFNVLNFELNGVKIENQDQEISLYFLENTNRKGISVKLKKLGSEERVVKLISFNDFTGVAIFTDNNNQILDLKISSVNQTVKQLLNVPIGEHGVMRFIFDTTKPFIRLLRYALTLGSGSVLNEGFFVPLKCRFDQWFPSSSSNLVSSIKATHLQIINPTFPPLESKSQSVFGGVLADRLPSFGGVTSFFEKRTSPRLTNKDFPGKYRRLDDTEINNSEGSPIIPIRSRRSSGITLFEPPPTFDPQILFIYPEDQANSIAITTAELPRLREEIFLNDRLIDFDLLYTLDNYRFQTKRDNIHVFCSLFYKELQLSGSSGVLKFINGMDIFEKDYLAFPINEHLHWYLLIVCHPKRILGSQSKTLRSIEIFSDEELEQEDELVALKESVESFEKCLIYQLDSLSCRVRSSAIETIKRFLIEEALRSKSVSSNIKMMSHTALKVPLQQNCTDCGLFLLEFFEMFSKSPSGFENLASQNALRDWFLPSQASARRGTLKNNIELLQEQYSCMHPVISQALPETNSSDVELIGENPSKK
jgi:hypothetical protein